MANHFSFPRAVVLGVTALISQHLVNAREAEISAGDQVVTVIDNVPLMSGRTTLLTLPSATELAQPDYSPDHGRTEGNQRSADDHFARAISLLQTGQRESAFVEFCEEIRQNPENATAYVLRGDIYRLRKEFDKALADLSKGIQLDPQTGYFYLVRGN